MLRKNKFSLTKHMRTIVFIKEAFYCRITDEEIVCSGNTRNKVMTFMKVYSVKIKVNRLSF